MKFYYDGVLYKEINQAPDYPMGTILNIYTDAGSGKGNNVYPKEWAIDYFRVYKRNEGYDIPVNSLTSHETGEGFYLDSESDKIMLTTDTTKASQWKMIPKGEYFLIQNVETGEYLHTENQTGYVEHGNVPQTYWSAQWKKEPVGNYFRLVNRWKNNQVIHTENKLGYLEIGELHQGAWRGQWSLN